MNHRDGLHCPRRRTLLLREASQSHPYRSFDPPMRRASEALNPPVNHRTEKTLCHGDGHSRRHGIFKARNVHHRV